MALSDAQIHLGIANKGEAFAGFHDVADVLCAAVDRLEEIYAGTTDLTLGYRLIEHQWH